MMLAASMAGVGFGSAGVHIPHACAYPIAGLKHAYQPPGYPDDHPFVPHGHSVIVTAPAAFRFTYEAAPERHDHVAALLGGDDADGSRRAAGRAARADARRRRAVGIGELGYGEDDIDALVEGALEQQRLLAVAPREVDRATTSPRSSARPGDRHRPRVERVEGERVGGDPVRVAGDRGDVERRGVVVVQRLPRSSRRRRRRGSAPRRGSRRAGPGRRRRARSSPTWRG